MSPDVKTARQLARFYLMLESASLPRTSLPVAVSLRYLYHDACSGTYVHMHSGFCFIGVIQDKLGCLPAGITAATSEADNQSPLACAASN